MTAAPLSSDADEILLVGELAAVLHLLDLLLHLHPILAAVPEVLLRHLSATAAGGILEPEGSSTVNVRDRRH